MLGARKLAGIAVQSRPDADASGYLLPPLRGGHFARRGAAKENNRRREPSVSTLLMQHEVPEGDDRGKETLTVASTIPR
jgi:hypothetical protein